MRSAAARLGRADPAEEILSMTKSKTHHVVPAPDGGWNVKRGGAEKASGHFDKKQDAIDAARQISRNQGTELKIHNKDGKISSSDSHGNDPNPPKG
jgi:type IV secretory pathway TrbL component